MKRLRTSIISVAAALGLASAAGGAVADPAPQLALTDTAPAALLSDGVYNPANPAGLEQAQFLWGGRNYCWYGGGWHGPGWYWCGYAWRRGFGWGGPMGWHGWRWHGGGWHGGWRHHGWHGHGGWHHGWH